MSHPTIDLTGGGRRLADHRTPAGLDSRGLLVDAADARTAGAAVAPR